jgi:hypothetical protein
MKFVVDAEVFTVGVVDKANRILTVGAAAGAHSAGAKAYQTGCEKAHVTGDDVYKLCTTIVGAASGNNYVDVVNAGGWAANDVLGVAGEWYPGCEEVTISSISVGGGAGGCDRINIGSNLSRTYTAGRPIVKLNRDCVIHGASDETPVANGGFINDPTWGAESRKYRLVNVELRCIGNNGSITYSGACTTGRSTYDGGPKFINSCSHKAYASGQNGGVGAYWSNYYTIRNSVFFNVATGLNCDGAYQSTVQCNFVIGGNVSIAARVSVAYLSAFEYTAMMSCTEWGLYQHHQLANYRGSPAGVGSWSVFKHFVSISDQYGYNMGGSTFPYFLSHFKIVNPRYRAVFKDWGSVGAGIHDFYGEYYGAGAQWDQASWWVTAYPMNTQDAHILLSRYGGDPDEAKLIYDYGWGERDHAIRQRRSYSWKFTCTQNDAAYFIGFGGEVFGEIGRPIVVQAWVRKSSAFNGTGPAIRLYDNMNNLLASDTIAVAHSTWELLSVTYVPTATGAICIWLGGYGSAGYFWIDSPTLDASGCSYELGDLASEWSFGNMAGGVRMAGGRING